LISSRVVRWEFRRSNVRGSARKSAQVPCSGTWRFLDTRPVRLRIRVYTQVAVNKFADHLSVCIAVKTSSPPPLIDPRNTTVRLLVAMLPDSLHCGVMRQRVAQWQSAEVSMNDVRSKTRDLRERCDGTLVLYRAPRAQQTNPSYNAPSLLDSSPDRETR